MSLLQVVSPPKRHLDYQVPRPLPFLQSQHVEALTLESTRQSHTFVRSGAHCISEQIFMRRLCSKAPKLWDTVRGAKGETARKTSTPSSQLSLGPLIADLN